MRLLIHLMVTRHCPGRVPPFGYPRINAYLQLPAAFRSLSRPSSAISALASTLRSSSLDLASSAALPRRFGSIRLPKTIENRISPGSWSVLAIPLSTSGSPFAPPCGFPPALPSASCSSLGLPNVDCLPVQFSRCVPENLPLPLSRFGKPSKRYRVEILAFSAFAYWLGLPAFTFQLGPFRLSELPVSISIGLTASLPIFGPSRSLRHLRSACLLA